MKVRYSFPVKSKTRTKDEFRLSSRGADIVVETDLDGVVTGISLTYTVDDPGLWPTIKATPNEATEFSVKMHSPFLEDAQQIVRAAEGALSLYGFEKIDWSQPKEEYIPQSAEEESRLDISSMSVSRFRVEGKDKEVTPFSIIATALLRSIELAPHELPLAFYRKGSNDAYEERYIEACIDFLFMLETLFANGKFKKNQVIAEYAAQPELIEAIREVQGDVSLVSIAGRRDPSQGKKIYEQYMSRTTDVVIARIVELRGFLHHSNQKLNISWHPDRHEDYLADALFLNFVCSKIALNIFTSNAFTSENEQEFLRCWRASKNH
ncbi:hypothetical protein [Pseudoxanthomonas sp.]|uniref:hypothetical protein n=1 Tax=Pseudoxanthomonas sp. TaxID=1871049 RepID=UPI0028C50FA7|nr:hypothetical protein [Pseudoxanthomonas sp.]